MPPNWPPGRLLPLPKSVRRPQLELLPESAPFRDCNPRARNAPRPLLPVPLGPQEASHWTLKLGEPPFPQLTLCSCDAYEAVD